MCLLKVYIEDERSGERIFIANNVAHILVGNGAFRILDIDGGEKIISGVNLLSIDALNSVVVLRAIEEIEIKG